MKRYLFDSYDSATPISDALLKEMGFQHEDSRWVYIVNGSYVIPEIHQEGNTYYIDTNERDGYPGLREKNSNDIRKIVRTLGDLKECYEKAAVLDMFDIEMSR